MSKDLSGFIATLPQTHRRFSYTKRAEKEFKKLDPSVATLFRRLLERIATETNGGGWKKLGEWQASVFGVESLYEAKANRKYRLFATFDQNAIILLGFGHRGEKEHFRHE